MSDKILRQKELRLRKAEAKLAEDFKSLRKLTSFEDLLGLSEVEITEIIAFLKLLAKHNKKITSAIADGCHFDNPEIKSAIAEEKTDKENEGADPALYSNIVANVFGGNLNSREAKKFKHDNSSFGGFFKTIITKHPTEFRTKSNVKAVRAIFREIDVSDFVLRDSETNYGRMKQEQRQREKEELRQMEKCHIDDFSICEIEDTTTPSKDSGSDIDYDKVEEVIDKRDGGEELTIKEQELLDRADRAEREPEEEEFEDVKLSDISPLQALYREREDLERKFVECDTTSTEGLCRQMMLGSSIDYVNGRIRKRIALENQKDTKKEKAKDIEFLTNMRHEMDDSDCEKELWERSIVDKYISAKRAEMPSQGKRLTAEQRMMREQARTARREKAERLERSRKIAQEKEQAMLKAQKEKQKKAKDKGYFKYEESD